MSEAVVRSSTRVMLNISIEEAYFLRLWLRTLIIEARTTPEKEHAIALSTALENCSFD